MAGVAGRSGPKQEKPWRDAIMRAVKRHAEGLEHPQALDCLADTLVAEGIKGDISAIKEIGDRLDGKPVQQQVLTGDGEDGSIVVQVIRFGDKPKAP